MAIPTRPPNRAVPQIYGDINNTDINEIFRRLNELSAFIEGRRGPIVFKDGGEFITALRRTILKLQAKGDRASGSISFEGTEGSSLYFAKGAYQADSGAWIATDSAPVIMELNADSNTPKMYRDINIQVGAQFSPTFVGYIAIGDNSGIATAGQITVENPPTVFNSIGDIQFDQTSGITVTQPAPNTVLVANTPPLSDFLTSVTIAYRFDVANPSAGTTNYPFQKVPVSGTIKRIRAIRVGTGTANVNVTLNGSDILGSDLVVGTSWTDSAVLTTAIAANDLLVVSLRSVVTTVDYLVVQIDVEE